MRHLSILFSFLLLLTTSNSQDSSLLSGIVKDAATNEALHGASITIYHRGKISGLVANKEGRFVIAERETADSVKVSMIGYASTIFYKDKLQELSLIEIKLTVAPAEMETVVVKSLTALDIIKKVIAQLSVNQPQQNFENKGFYREIIKEKDNYFSVAEAVFTAQYFPADKNCKLKLEQGRSKEDVSHTRLFEDFHPGGGPQAAADNSFVTGKPAFLNLKEIANFKYKIDSVVSFDGRRLYQISFDQKPGIKQALEKGILLIDKEDFAVVRFDVMNSPIGSPYIKDLTGTDKIMAGIMNIDFKRKGWKRRADFTRVHEKWVMSYAEAEYEIGYKQPKKNLDLDFTIKTELLYSDLFKDVVNEIKKDEEWKKKNIVANLPASFDAAFWGNNNIILPTAEVKNIIAAISAGNNDLPASAALTGWQYLNRNFFVANQQADTITLIPVMKCNWADDENGGMIFREMEGDFTIESKIVFTKNSDSQTIPDRGFQQGGLIVRSMMEGKENYVLLSAGTGGNPTPKLFFKRTIDNKSKTVVDKNETMNGWLRIEKSGKKIVAFFKEENTNEFKKTGEYNLEWLNGKVQLGLAVFAAFGGDGPKMKPDMRVTFYDLKIQAM